MQTRRVVITGMGSISPFGRGVDILVESLFNMKSAVSTSRDWPILGTQDPCCRGGP